MPSNLSADERAAVEWVTKNVVEAVEEGARFPLNDDDARHLRTLLAVVARAGEAVAWVVEFKRNDENEWRKSGPHLDYAEAERDQTRLLLRQWPAHIIPLYAHPADARDRGDAARLEWLNNHLHEFGGGVVTDEHRVEVYIDYDLTVVAHGETLREAIDHAMHAAPAAPEDK